MINDLKQLKKNSAKGQGIKDIWNSIKKGYDWLKKNKPI